MNAALTSGVLIWESFRSSYGPTWNVGNGTSEATPMCPATAVMNQADGPLGFLAPRLHLPGPGPVRRGLPRHNGGQRLLRRPQGLRRRTGVGPGDGARVA